MDGYAAKEEFINGACKLLSQNFDDHIKTVFQLYDFDKDNLVSTEDIRVLLSHVPLNQILSDKKDAGRKEGAYTKSGGGLYFLLKF
jgi:hypothetical protein